MAAKTVWFVRHGEAEHNALLAVGKAEEARALRDPALTARGVAQAKKLRGNPLLAEALASRSGSAAELLVMSPMRRTIETGCWAFGAAQLPVALSPDVQECGDHLNDVGSPPDELAKLFADCALAEQLREPLASLPGDWTEKKGVNAANPSAWAQRFKRFTEWVLDRSETRLVVVAHHGVLFEALGIRLDNCEVAEFSLSRGEGWKVVKRAPGRGEGEGEGSAAASRPFPTGKPPVLRPDGMIGRPYTARVSEMLKAMIPLTVIVAVLLAVVLGAEQQQGGGAAR